MASQILTARVAADTNTPQYRLPEADRQAILAKSDSYKIRLEIERQRLAFAERNGGCSFGLATSPTKRSK